MACCPWGVMPRLGGSLMAATLLGANVAPQAGDRTMSGLEDMWLNHYYQWLNHYYQKKANRRG